ncbi:MAG: Lrp/AsnC family transcriptional regulator [Candidatus Lokiarchaeota archaeon]|nr:Lrp/AsnC family transcriptional regulator [Candidatus Lokiarchaeota archaeon]
MEKNFITLKKLKNLDKNILNYLIRDSHIAYNKIADEIGTTRQNISQRVKKLEERKLINSYTITLNYDIIEELQVKAYVLFREDPDADIRKEDEKKLLKIPQISEFSRIFGKYDGILKLMVRDVNQLTEIMGKIHDIEGIKETETFIVHTRLKDDENSTVENLLK